jgi:2,3-bisphosphoglycerate-dependent phosphoglycerate mutase
MTSVVCSEKLYMGKSILILLCHGQSVWNAEKRFTGWQDIGLTAKGEDDARIAAVQMSKFTFDHIFMSTMVRAVKTAEIVIDELKLKTVPLTKNSALNERCYGELEGLTHQEVAAKTSEEQVRKWRRSFTECPPDGESLSDTYDRVIPYFEKEIVPLLAIGKTVLVVAHSNSLRSLIIYLHKMNEDDIENLSIPTAQPIVYELPMYETPKKFFYDI